MIQTPPFVFTSFFSQLALSLSLIFRWDGKWHSPVEATLQRLSTPSSSPDTSLPNWQVSFSHRMGVMKTQFLCLEWLHGKHGNMVKLRFHMISTKLFILFTLLYFFSWVCLTLLWVTQEYQWYLTRFSQSNNKRIQQVRTDGKELFAHYLFNSRGFTSRI